MVAMGCILPHTRVYYVIAGVTEVILIVLLVAEVW